VNWIQGSPSLTAHGLQEKIPSQKQKNASQKGAGERLKDDCTTSWLKKFSAINLWFF
jgi:hypothetical protein